MVVPEKILNMEVDTNKEFNQLNARILSKTQPSTSKGKAKATHDPPAPKSKSAPGSSKAKVTFDKKEPTTKKPGASRTKKGDASASSATRAAPIVGPTKGGARARQPTRKATGDQAPVKRERVKREREDEMEVDLWPKHEAPYPEQGPAKKRARHERPPGPFAWLAGTYRIEAPVISQGWNVSNYFTLIVSIPRLTPHLLLVEFDLGVVHGIMRSRAPIETRADGAYATFEWCGRDGEQFEGVINYHLPGMTGYLKFVRRADGAHTVRGKIQDLSFVGDAEFDGIWASPDVSIRSEWGDFSQTAYEYAIAARWG